MVTEKKERQWTDGETSVRQAMLQDQKSMRPQADGGGLSKV